MATPRKRPNPLDLLGGPAPSSAPEGRGRAPAPAPRPQRPERANPHAATPAPERKPQPAQQRQQPTNQQPPRPVPAPAPAPVEDVAPPVSPALPEFDASPVYLRSLLSHHLKYYGFAAADQELLDETLALMNHDIRCRNRDNWLVFNPVGRDFLLVTNDKELSRAAHAKGSAVRLHFLDMLQERPFPLGQLLLFREEFTEFFRPCSHLIALQVMSKPLVQALYDNPVTREYVLNVKHAVASVYKRRNRPLTVTKLQAVSLGVIADSLVKGETWVDLGPKMEQRVLTIAENDF